MRPENSARLRTAALYGAITLLGLVLRFLHVCDTPLQLDEAYTILMAQPPLPTIVELSPTDPNPPFNLIFYGLYAVFAGKDRCLWEVLSVLAGTLSPLALGIFLKRSITFSNTAGLYAALLLALSPCHIASSQYLRIYAIAVLIMIFAAYRSWRYVASEDRSPWIAFSALAVLANLHYYGTLIAISIGLWIVYELRNDRIRRKTAITALVCLAITLIPSVANLYIQYRYYYSFAWIAPPSLELVGQVLNYLAGGSPAVLAVIYSLGIFGAIELIHHRMNLRELRLFGMMVIPPLAAAIILSYVGKPFFALRYTIFFLPICIALAGIGAARIPARGQFVLPLIILLCHAGVTWNSIKYVQPSKAYRYGADGLSTNENALPIVLHTTKCSFVRGLLWDTHGSQHYLVNGAETSNVFHYWINQSEYVDEEQLLQKQCFELLDEHCTGMPAEIAFRRNALISFNCPLEHLDSERSYRVCAGLLLDDISGHRSDASQIQYNCNLID